MAQVRCPSCKKVFTLDDQYLGRMVRCRSCQTKFTAAAEHEATEPAANDAPEVMTVVAKWVGDPNDPRAAAATLAPAAPVGLSKGIWAAAIAVMLVPVLASGFVVAWSVFLGRSHSLYAGIEIGSKGVKLLVLDVLFDRHGEVVDVDIQADDQTNIGLGESLGADGSFARSAVDEAAGAITRYRDKAMKEFKVPPEQIFVVGASGLFAKLKDRKIPDNRRQQLTEANKNLLNKAVRERLGGSVQFISVDDEATQAFDSTVPDRYMLDAVFIDVGSGSIKGAVKASELSFLTLEVPLGTVEFAKRVEAQARRQHSLEDEARRLAELHVGWSLKSQLDSKTAFRNRGHVYLSGGIVWAIATYTHPADHGAFVQLQAQDLDRFIKLAASGNASAASEALAGLGDDQAAVKELKRVQDTFNQHQLITGGELVRTVWEEAALTNKQVYFPRYSRLSWILAYIKQRAVAH